MADTRARERLQAGRRAVDLPNPGKVLFPADGITKRELAGYYVRVAPLLLPWIRDRPLSLARYPDGLDGERIFQKNVGRHFPAWLPRAEVGKEGGELCQVLAAKPADLAYLAGQATIELHALLSRAGHLREPDQLIFDLDPPGTGHFDAVRRVALRLRQILDEDLGLASYVKTTGSKGLHVLVPLNAREGFGPVREFARGVAEVLAAAEPELVTTEQRKDARNGRIYADIMRNGYAQTAVAPYSVRARPGAPVAVPLRWDEVADPGLRPDGVTVRSIGGRLAGLAAGGGPWAGLSRHRYGLDRPRRRLARLAA